MIAVVIVEEEHGREHWHWFGRHRRDDDWDDRSPGGCTHGLPPDVPANLDPRPLVGAMAPLLAGAPADGTTTPAGSPAAVVWVDGGDEAVAHLDSLTARILDGAVVMSLDLETDQTGRAPVVARFAVAGAQDTAGLVAATDEVAGGHPVLAARWGAAVQNAMWAALLGLAGEHAAANGLSPAGISAVAGAVRLHLEAPVDLVTSATR
jgi:hypothetical protein